MRARRASNTLNMASGVLMRGCLHDSERGLGNSACAARASRAAAPAGRIGDDVDLSWLLRHDSRSLPQRTDKALIVTRRRGPARSQAEDHLTGTRNALGELVAPRAGRRGGFRDRARPRRQRGRCGAPHSWVREWRSGTSAGARGRRAGEGCIIGRGAYIGSAAPAPTARCRTTALSTNLPCLRTACSSARPSVHQRSSAPLRRPGRLTQARRRRQHVGVTCREAPRLGARAARRPRHDRPVGHGGRRRGR